ncbi:MAG: COG4223 family protein [Alkalilacustris sp.]
MASANDTSQGPRTPEDEDTPRKEDRETGVGRAGSAESGSQTPLATATDTETDGGHGATAPETASDATPQDTGHTGTDLAAGADGATSDTPDEQLQRDAEHAEAEARAQEELTASGAALAAGAGAGAGLAAAARGTQDETTPPRPAAATEPPRTAEPRRGGTMPLVLGGVIAAALGAGAVWWLDREGIVTLSGTDMDAVLAQLDRQAERLGGLEAGLSELESGLAGQVDRLAEAETAAGDSASGLAALAQRTDSLADTVEGLAAQLSEIADSPFAADPETRDLFQGFRDEVAALRAELEASATRADELIEAVAAEAERAAAAEAQLDGIAAEAATAEAMARARSALRLVEAAFFNGGPFDASLSVIEEVGVDIPVALDLLAETGVPTPSELLEEYPGAARESLQIALRDVEDKTLLERTSAFLQLQFGMRSLTPRDGDSVDAVLSRAEAALLAGALDEVLAEIATLPPEARTPLDAWAARVETRREAEAALADLTARIDQF